jgi:hypothetical protein
MQDQIDQYTRQSVRCWYVDGLSEMAGGAVVLLLALVYLIGAMLEPGPTTDLFLTIGQPAIVLVGALTARRMVSKAKEKLTYPRTGYARHHQPRERRVVRLIAMILGIGAVFGIVFGILQNFIQPAWIPGLSGAVIALLLVYLAYVNSIRRFYIMALCTLFLGLLVVTLQVADMFASSIFFGGFGMGWIVSGAVTLRHYLHTTKPTSEVEKVSDKNCAL